MDQYIIKTQFWPKKAKLFIKMMCLNGSNNYESKLSENGFIVRSQIVSLLFLILKMFPIYFNVKF